MGIKPLPHFENLLNTFAMQYKIKVQGNVETICMISKNSPDNGSRAADSTSCDKKEFAYREEEIPSCECIYG